LARGETAKRQALAIGYLAKIASIRFERLVDRLIRFGPDRALAARAEITPPLGATTYPLDQRRLLDQPGDENRSLAGSLTQLPGVSLGPNGQVHVRGQ
jgi:hypothetical protein